MTLTVIASAEALGEDGQFEVLHLEDAYTGDQVVVFRAYHEDGRIIETRINKNDFYEFAKQVQSIQID